MKRLALALLAAAIAPVAYSAIRGPGPDPLAQAVADGCTASSKVAIFLGNEPNWVYVNDKDAPASGPPPPPQWAKGVAHAQFEPHFATGPTSVDQPTTHLSYDFIINLRPDAQYQSLLGGDPGARTGSFSSQSAAYARLHSEWEEAAFPSWAWPDRGDRIELKGSWVWDCDHIERGAHTEFHPLRAIWVERNAGRSSPRSPRGETEANLFISTDKTPAGAHADCAHRTKPDREAFKRCVASEPLWQDVSGTYDFFLRAPPRPSKGAKLRVRVVDRGSVRAPKVRTTPTARGVRVSLTVTSPPGRRVVVGKQIFVGWSPMPAARLPEHLRVTFRRVAIRRAMDPGCPPSNPKCTSVQTTRGEQITGGAGEFALYWNVAGIWGPWTPRVIRARDGHNVRSGRSVDVYVGKRDRWRLLVTGRECDIGLANARGAGPVAPCPRSGEFASFAGDDDPGMILREFRSVRSALGQHRVDALVPGSTCPGSNKRGCYAVEFEVRRIDDVAARARAAR